MYPKSSPSVLPSLYTGVFWFVLFSLLWLLLTRGQGLIFGLFFALAASCSALFLHLRPRRIIWRHLPAALLFFLTALTQGALNVALRTLRRDCQLHPAWVRYEFDCADPSLQLLVAAIVGLLPGTVASRIDDDIMTLHLLDSRMDWETTIRHVERHVTELMPARRVP